MAAVLAMIPKIIFAILAWKLASFVGRVLVGAGMAVVTYQWVMPWIEGYLSVARGYLGMLDGPALQIFLMAGFGKAMSYVGTGIFAGASVMAAGNVVGLAMGGSAVKKAIDDVQS